VCSGATDISDDNEINIHHPTQKCIDVVFKQSKVGEVIEAKTSQFWRGSWWVAAMATKPRSSVEDNHSISSVVLQQGGDSSMPQKQMGEQGRCCERSPVVALRLPDGSTKRFADTEAYTYGHANDEECDGNLDYDPSPLAKSSHTMARSILSFGNAGLLPPVGLAGPHTAIRIEPVSTRGRLVEGF
jgi:hypothetical protein